MAEDLIKIKNMTIRVKEMCKIKKEYNSGIKATKKNITYDILFLNHSENYYANQSNSIQVILELKSIAHFFLNVYWRKKNKRGLIDDRYQIDRKLQGFDTDIHFSINNKTSDPCLQLSYKGRNEENYTTICFDVFDVMTIESALGKIANTFALDPKIDFDTKDY
jgi:hypothetical protein